MIIDAAQITRMRANLNDGFIPTRWESRALLDELEKARDERDKYKKLDQEAATHVESVIAMRTNFSGDPPYVGWKGLGLALVEALDERDSAHALLREIAPALEANVRARIDAALGDKP